MTNIVSIYIEDNIEGCTSATLAYWAKAIGLEVDESNTTKELSARINAMDNEIYANYSDGYIVLCEYPLDVVSSALGDQVAGNFVLTNDMGIYFSQDQELAGPLILEIAHEHDRKDIWQWEGGHFMPMLEDDGYDGDDDSDDPIIINNSEDLDMPVAKMGEFANEGGICY